VLVLLTRTKPSPASGKRRRSA